METNLMADQDIRFTIDAYRMIGQDNGPRRLVDYIDELEERLRLIDNTPHMAAGSSRCPLCGDDSPHTHTPLEQIIYRNGMKAGRVAASANENR